MVRFHLRRFEAWAISFTPLCPCLSEETPKAVGPNSCVSSRLGCLEYNYLRLETGCDIILAAVHNRQIYERVLSLLGRTTHDQQARTHAGRGKDGCVCSLRELEKHRTSCTGFQRRTLIISIQPETMATTLMVA